jgi:hypothetical protein
VHLLLSTRQPPRTVVAWVRYHKAIECTCHCTPQHYSPHCELQRAGECQQECQGRQKSQEDAHAGRANDAACRVPRRPSPLPPGRPSGDQCCPCITTQAATPPCRSSCLQRPCSYIRANWRAARSAWACGSRSCSPSGSAPAAGRARLRARTARGRAAASPRGSARHTDGRTMQTTRSSGSCSLRQAVWGLWCGTHTCWKMLLESSLLLNNVVTQVLNDSTLTV